jgi:hypothetical protein
MRLSVIIELLNSNFRYLKIAVGAAGAGVLADAPLAILLKRLIGFSGRRGLLAAVLTR